MAIVSSKDIHFRPGCTTRRILASFGSPELGQLPKIVLYDVLLGQNISKGEDAPWTLFDQTTPQRPSFYGGADSDPIRIAAPELRTSPPFARPQDRLTSTVQAKSRGWCEVFPVLNKLVRSHTILVSTLAAITT